MVEASQRVIHNDSALLRAKLRVPLCPDHHVRRPRLLDLLSDIERVPVTLVIAPAGSGKTVLMSSWAAETSMDVAWLSLDDSDRDGERLWDGVAAALRRTLTAAYLSVGRLPHRGEHPEAAATRLLNELDLLQGPPMVLILDDLQVLDHDQTVAAAVCSFLQHLPSWLHVVASSRREPGLPIERLRARGVIREVRFPELRFSDDEAFELFARLSPGLLDEQVQDTVARVGGWAAGLQISALAARVTRARGVDASTPDDGESLVVDYVNREVLAEEDPLLAQMLVETSVVGRMNDGLAQALTGRADASALLREAEARGLFVTRLGSKGWYTVHSLVRGALLSGLARGAADQLALQHGRAAEWFEAAHEVPEALEHYLAAGRPRDALRLLASEHPNLYDAGLETITTRTLERISVDVASNDLEALLEFAWCHILVSRQRFTEIVEHAGWLAEHSVVTERLRARLDMLRSIAAVINGEWIEGGRLARRIVHEGGSGWWNDPVIRFGWNMSCREIALTERWDESTDDVLDARFALAGDSPRRAAMEGTRAVGLALAGHPVDALRVAAGIGHASSAPSMTILRAELGLASALAYRELGDAKRADDELRALAVAPAETMLYTKVRATIELVHAHIDTGSANDARQWLGCASDLIEREGFGAGGERWLAQAAARLALLVGDVTQARSWACRIDDDFWGPLTQGRVSLAQADRRQALGQIDRAVPRCVRHEVVRGLLRSQAAEAHDEALKQVICAAELAAEHGLLQTVAAEGNTVVERIELASSQVPPAWMDRLRRVSVRRSESREVALPTLDALTDREREVVRYLQSRLTLREIAGEMFISVNTLKSHLKGVYRKLDVNSRSEVIEVMEATRAPLSSPASQDS